MAQRKYPNMIPLPVMADGTPLNGMGGVSLRGGNIATLPNVPEISQQPQINPMDIYKNLGINATQQGGSYIPSDYNSLKIGMENKLNFGNKQMAEMYKNPFYNQDTTLQGIQQSKNFQNPFLMNLEKQRGFLPQQQNTIPVNNPQPEAAVQQNNIIPDMRQSTPVQQENPFMLGLKKVGGALNTPLGRSLMVAGLGMATGGGAVNSLGYGLGTYAENKNNINEDAINRLLYKQYTGEDAPTGTGYLDDSTLKQVVEMQKYKQDTKTASLNNVKTQWDILEKQINVENLPAEKKAELLQKQASLEKTYQDIDKGKIDLKYLPQEKEYGLQKTVAETNKAQAEADFLPTANSIKMGQYGIQQDNLGLANQRLNLENEKFEYNKQKDAKKEALTAGNIGSLNAVKNQLDRFQSTFDVMPSKTNALTTGQFRKVTGTLTPAESNFNAQKVLLFKK